MLSNEKFSLFKQQDGKTLIQKKGDGPLEIQATTVELTSSKNEPQAMGCCRCGRLIVGFCAVSSENDEDKKPADTLRRPTR
jgi:hypothetical protein